MIPSNTINDTMRAVDERLVFMALIIAFYIVFLNKNAMILLIARSSNGRTEAFEAFNLGSIPSLATRKAKISII